MDIVSPVMNDVGPKMVHTIAKMVSAKSKTAIVSHLQIKLLIFCKFEKKQYYG